MTFFSWRSANVEKKNPQNNWFSFFRIKSLRNAQKRLINAWEFKTTSCRLSLWLYVGRSGTKPTDCHRPSALNLHIFYTWKFRDYELLNTCMEVPPYQQTMLGFQRTHISDEWTGGAIWSRCWVQIHQNEWTLHTQTERHVCLGLVGQQRTAHVQAFCRHLKVVKKFRTECSTDK